MVSMDTLNRIPLFHGLDLETLRDLCPMIRRMDVPAGTMIFREGTEAREHYYLDEGRVDITIGDMRPGGGLVHIVRPGESFGWSALVPPNYFTASARAHVGSSILVVNAEQLKQQMELHHDLMRVVLENIAATIAHRLEGTRIRMLTGALTSSANADTPAETFIG